jgi:hypothetical protein
MKNNIIKLVVFTILIVLFMVSCKHNKEIVYETKNGEKWIREYFPKSRMIKVEGRYKDTLTVGIKRAYTHNGLLFFEVRYNEFGKQEGICRFYYDKYPNGNFLEQEGQYHNDLPIGTWKFQRPNGTLYLIIDIDSSSHVTYFARFNEKGHFLKDSIGYFSCDTSKLW